MKLYDSHTHLNAEPLFQDWESYLQKFVDAGGVGLVNAGASESYNLQGIEIAKAVGGYKMQDARFKNVIVKSTVGYHPDCCSNGEITEKNIQQRMLDLKLLYEANKEYIVAIGECGIDTYYPGSEEVLPLQKKLFALQCDLAKELHLPLVIHVRKDFDSMFEILKNYRDMTVYIHCRGFSPNEYKILNSEFGILNSKLFIGFCGNVTYKNAQMLRDSLALVAPDQLLLETDAPWLGPQALRGTTNHPANVKYIYEFVAEYLKVDIEVLALQVEKNFKAVYNYTPTLK